MLIDDGCLVIKEDQKQEKGEEASWSSRSHNTRLVLPNNCETDKIKGEMMNICLFQHIYIMYVHIYMVCGSQSEDILNEYV